MKTINYNWPSAAVFLGAALFLWTTAACGQINTEAEAEEGAGQKTALSIELQIPAGVQEVSVTEEGFAGTNAVNPTVQERLAAMDALLAQVAQEQSFSGETVSPAEAEEKTSIPEDIPAAFSVDKEFSQRGRVKDVSTAALPGSSKGVTLVLSGLNLALSIVLLTGWIKYQQLANKVRQIGLRLQEKEKSITHENIVRKAVEDASLQREKEYQHLKEVLAKNEQILLQREKECQRLKEALAQNTLPKIETPEGDEGIAGKSKEKRASIRLDLSRDYRKTVILRMKLSPRGKHLKCFATNIALHGLCFETKEHLPEKAPVSLRLFFYGETAPIMDIQAAIVWKKEMNALNYYGVMWTWPEKEEENRNCVKRYIESKVTGE